MVRTAVKTCQGHAPILAGAGGPTRNAIAFAQEAERQGAAGLLLMPHYLTEAPQDGKQYARKDGDWAEVQAGGGGVLPMVNGETPPVLMYGGNQLIYARVE